MTLTVIQITSFWDSLFNSTALRLKSALKRNLVVQGNLSQIIFTLQFNRLGWTFLLYQRMNNLCLDKKKKHWICIWYRAFGICSCLAVLCGTLTLFRCLRDFVLRFLGLHRCCSYCSGRPLSPGTHTGEHCFRRKIPNVTSRTVYFIAVGARLLVWVHKNWGGVLLSPRTPDYGLIYSFGKCQDDSSSTGVKGK